jgi:hypothetical protein
MNEWTPSAIYFKMRKERKDFTGELLCECRKLNHFLFRVWNNNFKMNHILLGCFEGFFMEVDLWLDLDYLGKVL